MSWYVQQLIRNCDKIRSSINTSPEVYFDGVVPEVVCIENGEEENIEPLYEQYPYFVDYEDGSFQDLLLLEKTIQDLYNNKKISVLEHLIIMLYSKDTPMEDMIKQTGILSKLTIMKIFSKVCDRIGFILGGEFTDEGLIDKLSREHNLTEDQVQKVRDYLNRNVGVKNI